MPSHSFECSIFDTTKEAAHPVGTPHPEFVLHSYFIRTSLPADLERQYRSRIVLVQSPGIPSLGGVILCENEWFFRLDIALLSDHCSIWVVLGVYKHRIHFLTINRKLLNQSGATVGRRRGHSMPRDYAPLVF